MTIALCQVTSLPLACISNRQNMLSYYEASLVQLSVHRVGNKLQNEYYVLSERPVALRDEMLPKLLMQYFLSPFEKVNEVYRFTHPNGELALNELYHFSRAFFEGSEDFHAISKQISKHLYEASGHPKIKPGEVYVAHFRQVQLEGELQEAIGIFKSETKETYLKVFPEQDAFRIDYEEEAINIHKLDKGCLIVNTEGSEGYKVLAVDQTNRQQEAIYWKDDFLRVKLRNDHFHQTSNFLDVYKHFVNEKLDDVFELEKADKIDLLNRSMEYFRKNDTFEQEEFEEEVLGNPQAAGLFRNYKEAFETEHDSPFGEQFRISEQAVKKKAATYKSVLKLDKNFHVYVHGKREYIEKGFDEERGMNYYKLYFEQES